MKPPDDYKFELFTVALVGAGLGMVPLIIVFAVTKNIWWALGVWALVPLSFVGRSAWGTMQYVTSTPGDHRYRFRAFFDSDVSNDVCEDEVLKVALKVFELNQQAKSAAIADHDHSHCSGEHEHDAEPRRPYPCSMAVPKEAWEKGAANSAEKAAWLVARANEEEPQAAAKLLTRAAVIYSNITMGLRFDGDAHAYRRRALPLLPVILDKVEVADLPDAERAECLQRVASVAQMLDAHELACTAYEKLLPWIRGSGLSPRAIAALLSNYAYSAKRVDKRSLASTLRAEANNLWQDVPQAQIEAEMLRQY